MNASDSTKQIIFDIDQQCIQHNGLTIYLSRTLYRLLNYLVHNEKKPIYRTELLQYIWGNGHFERNELDKSISKLRKYLGDKKRTMIVTIHGCGYLFSGDILIINSVNIPKMENIRQKISSNMSVVNKF